MKKKILKNNRKVLLVAVCMLLLLLGGVVLLQETTEPNNPIEDTKVVSSMWHTNTTMLVDQEKISTIDSANINLGQQEEETPETEETTEEEQEPENESEEPKPSDTEEEITDSEESSDESDEAGTESSSGEESQPGSGSSGEEEELGSIGSGEGNEGSGDFSQLVEIDKNSASSGEQPGNNPGNDPGNDTGDIEQGNDTSDEGESVDAYFSTSIISGDVVNDAEYSFTIKHLKPELTVAGILVTVNGQEEAYAPKTGRFETNLQVGENKIVVEVLYRSGSDTITASKGYTLYYTPAGEVILITDLTDRTVDQDSVTFDAYGMRGSERLEAKVEVNGKAIRGNGETFTANLELGENIINITVGGRKDSITQTYKVTYAEDVFKVVTTISDTVLYGTENQTQPELVIYTSENETFSFKVHVNQVTGKEKLVSVRAFYYDNSNGKLLKKDANSNYTVTIPTRGAVLLTLKYLDSEEQQHEYQYIVRYDRADGTTPTEKQPSIEANVEVGSTIMNLKSGMEFKTPDVIVNISAKSCQNEPLYGSDFEVTVNGFTHAYASYQQGSVWFGYDVHMNEGENTVSIKVTDQDGYSVTKVYKLYYTPGKVKVTISVEASTVGLGYLIPPQVVEVDGGTSVAQILMDVLTANGYGYDSRGGLEGFYLAAILGDGIKDGYSIPEDLKTMIETDGGDIAMDTGGGDMNRLGEFDFYRYSGWMYSYNGSYPGYGMGVCKPQDGAVIRVRFTLALGKDIGGFVATGNTYEGGSIAGNYGKEW